MKCIKAIDVLPASEVTSSLDEEKGSCFIKIQILDYRIKLRQYLKNVYLRNRSANKHCDENKNQCERVENKAFFFQ